VIWRRVVPSLAADRLVLAPDLPGLGQSPPVDDRFDLRTVADALARDLPQRIAGGAFDLVGNSLGGAIALLLAARHPELVRRLVLVSPAGFAPRPRAVSAAIGLLGGRAVAFRRLVGSRLAASAPARRALLWGTIAEPHHMSSADARTMFESSRGSAQIGAALFSVLQADLRDDLARLEVPLGLIWGERDRIIPMSTLDAILELHPEVVVETIPRAAHVPHIERPVEFVAALDQVLARL
jgi:pimeloyl-ACP methyl ester carboxylesterase